METLSNDDRLTDDKLAEILKIEELIKKKNIEFIRFEQCDMHGTSRSKVVMSQHFRDKVIKGQVFSSILTRDPHWNYIKVTGSADEAKRPNFVGFPDLKTFLPLPWSENTARVIVNPVERNGSPLYTHPRWIAIGQIRRLENLGFRLLSGIEHEFYVFDDQGNPLNEGVHGASTRGNSQYSKLFQPMLRHLISAGIDVDVFEAEVGPGQFEITHTPCWGIDNADKAFTLKTGLQEMAEQRGYQLSFMTNVHQVTSSMAHFNHSLWDINGQQCVFYDSSRPNNLSELAEHWMAGNIAHANSIACLLAPTVNCWHKKNQYIETIPINASWGVDNRTSYLRVQNTGPSGTLVEARAASSNANPYLVMAAIIADGIDGIKQRLALPPEVKGNALKVRDDHFPPLPKNLCESLDALSEDKVIVDALGENFVDCFTALKRHEIQVCKDKYTIDPDWDRKYYFNL